MGRTAPGKIYVCLIDLVVQTENLKFADVTLGICVCVNSIFCAVAYNFCMLKLVLIMMHLYLDLEYVAISGFDRDSTIQSLLVGIISIHFSCPVIIAVFVCSVIINRNWLKLVA